MRMTGLNQYQQEVLRTTPRDPNAYPIALQAAIKLMRSRGDELRRNGLDSDWSRYANDLLKMWDQMIWALGLAGESGEFCDGLKKKLGHGKDVHDDYFKKELGDVQWYGNALADSFGYTAEDIATENSDKLRARHPNGFTVESAAAKADELPAQRDWIAEHVNRAVISVPVDSNGTPVEEVRDYTAPLVKCSWCEDPHVQGKCARDGGA